jgi:CRISPR-associated exonuclease Cas4
VPFDTELRALTETTVAQLREMFASRVTPPAMYRAARCRACSLLELCRPKPRAKSALVFLARVIDSVLGRDEVAS